MVGTARTAVTTERANARRTAWNTGVFRGVVIIVVR